ncbi:ATP dependent DNA ligase [Hymenopellis radicata]|nr:ATP dependent DNA ligase [Hymenopellis radicata]
MAASLLRTRGFLSLTGPLVDALAQNSLDISGDLLRGIKTVDEFHITVLTKAEFQSSPASIREGTLPLLDTSRIYSTGIGGNASKGVFFVVIIWVAGQQFRRRLGLPPKEFHITLSHNDDHTLKKGITSLFYGQFPSAPSPDLLDHVIYTLHLFSNHIEEEKYSIQLVKALPDSHRGFLRLGDAAFSLEKYKLAMLAYACAFVRSGSEPKPESYCLRKLSDCARHAEWGLVFQESEKGQLPDDLVSSLIVPWPNTLRQAIRDTEFLPTLMLSPRESLSLGRCAKGRPLFHRLPRFFRWLIPFHFAIMSTPRNEKDIAFLAELGIKRVLTLTEEEPLPKAWFTGKPVANTFLPVTNTYPPSIEQMTIIMRLFEEARNLPLLVHCGGGKGRAGTVAACYLAAYGFGTPQPNQEHPEMSAADAISTLRMIRPGSIETIQQEEFVSRWCSTIWKQQSILPELPSEPPPWPLEIEGKLDSDNDLFILVGLPGSGKSWLSQALVKRDPKVWTYISQDEIGSRAFCENTIGRHPSTKRVILDRCNTSPADRRAWLDLASSWACSPVCVWFDYERDLCLSRAQQRASHPTLPPGNRVRSAVAQMHEQFQRPTLEEGFKVVIVIRSFSACAELVELLSPSTPILKFPRTPHLIDVGGATPDDLVLDTSVIPGHVIITEKVDGANMGFSLSADKTKVLVQNRSHYVNSSTHAQFKKLGHWMEQHHDDLLKVLDRDEHFPERFILYGEWLFATHSIPYAHLPDMFIAFDLHDRVTGQFASRQGLLAALVDTTIHVVPVMYEGDMPSDVQLKDMIQRPSSFWDGRVEGVYVKVEAGGNVVSRSKVVRSDFIAGNDHWTKGKLRVNGFRHS